MRWLMAVLILVTAVSYAADDGILRNESGEHVVLGATSLGEIRWVLVDDDGKLLIDSEDTLEVVTTTAPALDWAVDTVTVGTSDSLFSLGDTAVEVHLQNTHSTQEMYVGFDGSDYFTIFPRASFSFSNLGLSELHFKGEAAGSHVQIVWSSE